MRFLPTLAFRFFAGIFSFAVTSALHADVLLVGSALNRSSELTKHLREANLTAKPAGPEALHHIDAAQTRLVVLAPEKALPPETRRGVSRFLASGGHIMVVGAHAFDYAPRPTRPARLGSYTAPEGYRIVHPKRRGTSRTVSRAEPARVETLTGPDGKPALYFRTYLRGMANFLVELDAGAVRSARRSVLQFWARGDSYMDLLAIEIRDTQGQNWLGFVPIGGEWKQYSISLADFLPEGWANPDEPYPLLDPGAVAAVGLGTNMSTLWPEKPMTLALGSVDLAEDESGFYAPTSALLALRLPFIESGMTIPAWLFDPFAGAQRVPGEFLIVPSGGAAFEPPVVTGGWKAAAPLWLCPPPNLEHPGPRMGTDHRKDYILKFERESRRIPLWEALDQDGFSAGAVAELRIAASGKLAGANLALFGMPFKTLQSQPALVDSVARTIVSVVNRPKVAGVTINTTPSKHEGAEDVVPTLKVIVQNPLSRAVHGKLVASAGGDQLRGEANLMVPARATASAIVPLSAVPADFPFSRFEWHVAFESDAGRDELRDRVDVERALIHASRHMVRTQQSFPDGRISHHYFGDAYGARAMIAYADVLRRQPERLAKNPDLWRFITPAAIEASGIRFFDMLVRRQNEDGSIPMGYSEHLSVYNVADGGQIALGAGQVAPLLSDPARRERYLQFCRRFVDWAETFYIDEKLSAELSERLPDRAKKGETKVGHYGLGWGYLTRNQTGPFWVLPDILGVQTLLTQVDPNPDYRRIWNRNLSAYLDAGYRTEGFFWAEALMWSWLTSPDESQRARIAAGLRSGFIATLLQGEVNDMYERGARANLKALPLLYYRRYIEDNTALRAVLLKYVWSFASEDAPNAMRRVAETFPKPAHGESIAASKQAACGAIWAMELLEPGSSLLRVDGFPRIPGAK